MSEPQHAIRGKRVLLWLGLFALIVAALTLPPEWLAPLDKVFGERQRTTPFDDDVATLDEELESADASLTDAEAQRLVPRVAARRLLRAGPMTTNQMDEATAIWANAMRAAANEPEGGSADAHFSLAEKRIIESFPRLDPERVREELSALRDQVDAARPPHTQGGGGVEGADLACSRCHRNTRPLPEGRTFDHVGIYPFMADAEELADGRRVPVLVESLELEATANRRGDDADLGDAECLTCHAPHGSDGFRVTRKDRVDNMGLWVNVLQTEPNILHLEVKVKNAESGHRVPGGPPQAAYVTTVQAFQNDVPLERRFGRRLPEHLRTETYGPGSVFARHFVNADGNLTTDVDEIADLQFDSRLESGRFDTEHFAFDRRDDSVARVLVTLWYLPDYATWKGARAIRRADKPER